MMSILKKAMYHNIERVLEPFYLTMSNNSRTRALKIWYRIQTGEELDFDNLRNFNEKLQWLKIYDSTPIKTALSDKFKVRAWIAKKIGDSYLIPLLGNWKNASDIQFDRLPRRYVLKVNHGSGMNYIVKDNTQESFDYVRKLVDDWLNTPSGIISMEQQYFNIERRIIAEQYIEQSDGGLLDYKIHCFKGTPRFIQVIGERILAEHKANEAYFDLEWNQLAEMHNIFGKLKKLPKKPKNLKEMLSIAKKLSEDFEYVRVDLYNVDGKIYFGEMTFTPAQGLGKWAKYVPKDWWQ